MNRRERAAAQPARAALLLLLFTAGARAAGVGHDPRPLTPAEIATFVPLVCAGPRLERADQRSPRDGKLGPAPVYRCATVLGRTDRKGLGDLGGFSLTSILYGTFDDTGRRQAYLSYSGLEPHTALFGGGILFNKVPGGWRLGHWAPGGAITGCLALTAAPDWQLLCLTGDSHMDVSTESLGVLSLRESVLAGDAAPRPGHLSGSFRFSHDVDAFRSRPDDCDHLPPGNPLYSVDALTRSTQPGIFADVAVSWVPSLQTYDPCADTHVLRHDTLRLRLHGAMIEVIAPPGLRLPLSSDAPR